MASQPAYSKLLLCLFMLVTSAHCSTTNTFALKSTEFRRPLRDVRKAVYFAMKGNVAQKSENGRTFYSPWHKPGMNLKRSSYKQKERARLIITVFGDRRPYWVEVVYRVERLNGGKYTLRGYDKKRAQKYLLKVEDFLASRPEERDVIDDFRPY